MPFNNITNDVANLNFFRILDKKEYELKDHLGNVRVAIGDMKLPENEATSTRGVPPFLTDEKAVNDYYPYGMGIAERSYQTANYRYGYNGKENDNEVKGTGNSIDYGARIYDPRVGSFLSLDPLRADFPWNSPYNYAENQPINSIDIDGEGKHYMYAADIQKQKDGTFKEINFRPLLDEAGGNKYFYDISPDDQPVTFYTYKGQTSTDPTLFSHQANEAGEYFRLQEKNGKAITLAVVAAPFVAAVGVVTIATAATAGAVAGGIYMLGDLAYNLYSTTQNSINNTDNPTSIAPAVGKKVGGKYGEIAGNVVDIGTNIKGLKIILQPKVLLNSVSETVKLVSDVVGTINSSVETYQSVTQVTSNTNRSASSFGILKTDSNNSSVSSKITKSDSEKTNKKKSKSEETVTKPQCKQGP